MISNNQVGPRTMNSLTKLRNLKTKIMIMIFLVTTLLFHFLCPLLWCPHVEIVLVGLFPDLDDLVSDSCKTNSVDSNHDENWEEKEEEL